MRDSMKTLITVLFLITLSFAVNAEQAKNFDLDTLDGKINLKELKGKVVYLDFWASWCSPCRKSFPWMNKLHSKYESQGLEIIGVSLDGKRKHTETFLKKTPALFTIALDPDGVVADDYKVQVMPTSYLIGRNGELLWEHKGFRTKQQDKLEDAIASALKL